jgi:hypothetical protein
MTSGAAAGSHGSKTGRVKIESDSESLSFSGSDIQTHKTSINKCNKNNKIIYFEITQLRTKTRNKRPNEAIKNK